MTPAAYLRGCRQAAGLSLASVALCIDTVPDVDARRRGELLEDIEAGLVPVTLSTAVALAAIPMLGIDLRRLAELVDAKYDPPRLVAQVPVLLLARRAS